MEAAASVQRQRRALDAEKGERPQRRGSVSAREGTRRRGARAVASKKKSPRSGRAQRPFGAYPYKSNALLKGWENNECDPITRENHEERRDNECMEEESAERERQRERERIGELRAT